MLLLALSLAQAQDLSGTWAMQVHIVSETEAVLIGKLQSHTYSWVRLSLDHQEDQVAVDHQVCDSAVKGSLFKSRVPAAYVAAVPRKKYTVKLGEDGSYKADFGLFHMGMDPGCAEMPTSAEDACLRDTDKDGHPGATIQVKVPMFSWADVYVAQRNRIVLDGKLLESGEIYGRAEPQQTAVEVVGASNRMFARSPKPPTTVFDQSEFRMVRLDGDAGCDAVLSTFQGK